MEHIELISIGGRLFAITRTAGRTIIEALEV